MIVNINSINISIQTFITVKPLIVVVRMFGLLPITYCKNKQQYSMKWSHFYAIYSYLLHFSFAIYALLGMYLDSQANSNDSHRMGNLKHKAVTCLDVILITTIALYGVLVLPLKVKNFLGILQNLDQADRIISLKYCNYHRRRSAYSITIILSILLLFFFYDILVWGCIQASINKIPWHYISMYMGFYFLYYTILVKELFFWHMVYYIKIRLNAAHSFLVKSQQINPIARFGKSSLLLEEITKLNKYYGKILNSIDSLNSSMGYALTLLVFNDLIHMVISPYFFLNELLTTVRPPFVLLQFLWSLSHFGRIIILIEPCQRCINQQQETLTLACYLLYEAKDADLKQKLADLVHQFKSRKVEFTACGYFYINRSLLTSIMATTGTYLVILLEMK